MRSKQVKITSMIQISSKIAIFIIFLKYIKTSNAINGNDGLPSSLSSASSSPLVSNPTPLDCISAHANGYRRVRMPKSSRIINHSPDTLHNVPMHYMDPSQFHSNVPLLDSEYAVPGTATIDEEIRYDPETSVFYRVRKIRRRKKKKNKKKHNSKNTEFSTESKENDNKNGNKFFENGPIVTVDNENKVHFLPDDNFMTIEDLQKKNQNYQPIYEGITPIPESIRNSVHPYYTPTTTSTVSPIIVELLSKINNIQHQATNNGHVSKSSSNKSPTIAPTTTEYSANYVQFVNSATESQKQFYNGNSTNWIKEWNYSASNKVPGTNSTATTGGGFGTGSVGGGTAGTTITLTTSTVSPLAPTPAVTTGTITPNPYTGTPIVYFTSSRPSQTVATISPLQQSTITAKVIASPSIASSSNRYVQNGAFPSSHTQSSSSSPSIEIDSTRASVAVIAFCVALLLLTALILLVMHRETVWIQLRSLRTIFDHRERSCSSSSTTSSSPTTPPTIVPPVIQQQQQHQQQQQQQPVIGLLSSNFSASLRRSKRDSEIRQQVPTFTSISANRIVDGVVVNEDDGELIGQIIPRSSDHSYFESTQRSKQYLSRVQRWVPKRPPLPDDLLEKQKKSNIPQYNAEQHPNSTFPRDYRSEC